jgi:hypothetical protein
MGLSPATAFACLFDLLFRPTPATLAMHGAALQVGPCASGVGAALGAGRLLCPARLDGAS